MSDRSDWTPPKMHECYSACLANAKQSDAGLVAARARVSALPPGHVALPSERELVQQRRAERDHWNDYAEYYRLRCLEEGDLTVPKMIRRGDFS